MTSPGGESIADDNTVSEILSTLGQNHVESMLEGCCGGNSQPYSQFYLGSTPPPPPLMESHNMPSNEGGLGTMVHC
jgi:hypothetical protein